MLHTKNFTRRSLILIIGLLIVLSWTTSYVRAQESDSPVVQITLPQDNQALQGIVTISIISSLDASNLTTLEFQYFHDTNQTWFLIWEGQLETGLTVETQWDTTTLTDGIYTIRVTVISADGTIYEDEATELRIRNYTPIETETPSPTQTSRQTEETILSTKTLMPTKIPPATTTPIPPNQARLTLGQLGKSLLVGVGISISAIGIFGLYAFIQQQRNR